MGFKYFNANPFNKRQSDCTVRAISVLTGESWDNIYIDLSLQGFLSKAMPVENSVWGDYLRQLGYTKYVCHTNKKCPSIAEFAEIYNDGKYLACTGSHVVAIVNGNYYDTWDSGDEIVDYYWRKET